MYKLLPKNASSNDTCYWLIMDEDGNDCTGNLYTFDKGEELCNYLNEHTKGFAETFLSDMINGHVSFNFND